VLEFLKYYAAYGLKSSTSSTTVQKDNRQGETYLTSKHSGGQIPTCLAGKYSGGAAINCSSHVSTTSYTVLQPNRLFSVVNVLLCTVKNLFSLKT
jgi:hypothetical protein